TYYNRDIWEMIAEALEALSRESFTIKMIWLKDRLKQMSANAAPDVLEQFLDWCPEGRDVVDFSLAASSGGHLITYNLCTISFLS
ncbi:hypothetical protein S245_015914, partial [Arachis hypogaea]